MLKQPFSQSPTVLSPGTASIIFFLIKRAQKRGGEHLGLYEEDCFEPDIYTYRLSRFISSCYNAQGRLNSLSIVSDYMKGECI